MGRHSKYVITIHSSFTYQNAITILYIENKKEETLLILNIKIKK